MLALAVLGLWCSLPFIVRPLTSSRRTRVLAAMAGLFYLLAGAGYLTSEGLYVQHTPRPASVNGAPEVNGITMAARRERNVTRL